MLLQLVFLCSCVYILASPLQLQSRDDINIITKYQPQTRSENDNTDVSSEEQIQTNQEVENPDLTTKEVPKTAEEDENSDITTEEQHLTRQDHDNPDITTEEQSQSREDNDKSEITTEKQREPRENQDSENPDVTTKELLKSSEDNDNLEISSDEQPQTTQDNNKNPGITTEAQPSKKPDSVGAPPYYESVLAIKKAYKLLKRHLISLEESNNTDLTDYRRHYAAALHFLLQGGLAQSECPNVTNYYDSYERYVEKFVPEGLSYPKIVIQNYKEIFSVFRNHTQELRELVHFSCIASEKRRYPKTCNQMIEDAVQEAGVGSKLMKEGLAVLLMGDAVKEFLEVNNDILSAAKNFTLKYIINGILKLHRLIEHMARYYRVLHAMQGQRRSLKCLSQFDQDYLSGN